MSRQVDRFVHVLVNIADFAISINVKLLIYCNLEPDLGLHCLLSNVHHLEVSYHDRTSYIKF